MHSPGVLENDVCLFLEHAWIMRSAHTYLHFLSAHGNVCIQNSDVKFTRNTVVIPQVLLTGYDETLSVLSVHTRLLIFKKKKKKKEK